MDWIQDQYVIAGIATLAFSILCLAAYIAHKERRDRINIEPTEGGEWPL